jgi:hypothetical protein
VAQLAAARSAKARTTRGQPPPHLRAISSPSGPSRSKPLCSRSTLVPASSATKRTSTSVAACQSGLCQVNRMRSGGDPQAYLDRIERVGGKTIVPVTEIPDMVTFAQFADPEGNVVGLVKAQ